jgi:hypothetical protein
MSDLEAFLEHNVEGYLFSDLRAMKPLGIGYPLLMTTFAGIELLGALTSSSRFGPRQGSAYFNSYWRTYLYPQVKDTEKIGNTLYQLVRHGIAHGFVVKGPMAVAAGGAHLECGPDGLIYVDPARLADEFIHSFTNRVKPLVANTTGAINGTSMAARLGEMAAEYQAQAAHFPVASVFPLNAAGLKGPVTQSLAPSSNSSNSRQDGPTGPTFSSEPPGSGGD